MHFVAPKHLYTKYKGCEVRLSLKEREKEEGTISGQPLAVIPNLEVLLQPCVSVQNSAGNDTSGKTLTLSVSLVSWVQQHLAGKQCSYKEHLHDSEKAKFANIPNESGHSSALKVCNADATLFKDALSIGTVLFSSLLGNIFTALKYTYMFLQLTQHLLQKYSMTY